MPIYEYECQSCGHRHEALQKMSEDPLTDCPQCEEPKLKKLVSAAAFRLKGGGWYETDFKKDSKKNLVESDKPTSKADKDKKASGDKKADGGEKKSDKSSDSSAISSSTTAAAPTSSKKTESTSKPTSS